MTGNEVLQKLICPYRLRGKKLPASFYGYWFGILISIKPTQGMSVPLRRWSPASRHGCPPAHSGPSHGRQLRAPGLRVALRKNSRKTLFPLGAALPPPPCPRVLCCPRPRAAQALASTLRLKAPGSSHLASCKREPHPNCWTAPSTPTARSIGPPGSSRHPPSPRFPVFVGLEDSFW